MPRKWSDGDALFGEYQSILFDRELDDGFPGFLRDADREFLTDAEGVELKEAN